MAVVIVVAMFAPWLAPYGPMTADPTVYLLPPGGSHPLGTDGAGMDIFSRVVFAPRVDLAIAIVGTLLSAMIGGVSARSSATMRVSGRGAARSARW